MTIVDFGKNEISFNDKTGVKVIYGFNNFNIDTLKEALSSYYQGKIKKEKKLTLTEMIDYITKTYKTK